MQGNQSSKTEKPKSGYKDTVQHQKRHSKHIERQEHKFKKASLLDNRGMNLNLRERCTVPAPSDLYYLVLRY